MKRCCEEHVRLAVNGECRSIWSTAPNGQGELGRFSDCMVLKTRGKENAEQKNQHLLHGLSTPPSPFLAPNRSKHFNAASVTER